MEKGIIIKGVGGAYDVLTDAGLVTCTLRGRLRLQDRRILVGDRVEISREGESGVVENILPRTTELIRPAIANVEQAVVVFSVENPSPILLLLDRILVNAHLAGVDSVVVINKADLDIDGAEKLAALYDSISYPTLVTSVRHQLGLDDLRKVLDGRVSTLAGPSGVGKSSLLNAVEPGLQLETGEVSERLQRGRHTTRTVQLLPFGHDGLVADTPGFSQLTVTHVAQETLQYSFPEMEPYLGLCQFRGCLHHHEPRCAVKDAVQAGKIHRHRYDHYILFLHEIEDAQPY